MHRCETSTRATAWARFAGCVGRAGRRGRSYRRRSQAHRGADQRARALVELLHGETCSGSAPDPGVAQRAGGVEVCPATSPDAALRRPSGGSVSAASIARRTRLLLRDVQRLGPQQQRLVLSFVDEDVLMAMTPAGPSTALVVEHPRAARRPSRARAPGRRPSCLPALRLGPALRRGRGGVRCSADDDPTLGGGGVR